MLAFEGLHVFDSRGASGFANLWPVWLVAGWTSLGFQHFQAGIPTLWFMHRSPFLNELQGMRLLVEWEIECVTDNQTLGPTRESPTG